MVGVIVVPTWKLKHDRDLLLVGASKEYMLTNRQVIDVDRAHHVHAHHIVMGGAHQESVTFDGQVESKLVAGTAIGGLQDIELHAHGPVIDIDGTGIDSIDYGIAGTDHGVFAINNCGVAEGLGHASIGGHVLVGLGLGCCKSGYQGANGAKGEKAGVFHCLGGAEELRVAPANLGALEVRRSCMEIDWFKPLRP